MAPVITINRRNNHTVDAQVIVDALAIVFAKRCYKNRWWTIGQLVDIVNLEYACIVGIDGAVEVRDSDFTKTIFRDESGNDLSIGEGASITWETVPRGKHGKIKLVSFFDNKKLGVEIDFSPKCHPELAGEGIEYSWGFAKRMYRREWLWKDDKDRKRKDFFELVRKVLSGKDNGALNKERVRRMAGRARGYIVAYLMIEEQSAGSDSSSSSSSDGGSGGGEKGLSSVSFNMIEKMVKGHKTHRSALDFDLKFIRQLESPTSTAPAAATATAAASDPPDPPNHLSLTPTPGQ